MFTVHYYIHNTYFLLTEVLLSGNRKDLKCVRGLWSVVCGPWSVVRVNWFPCAVHLILVLHYRKTYSVHYFTFFIITYYFLHYYVNTVMFYYYVNTVQYITYSVNTVQYITVVHYLVRKYWCQYCTVCSIYVLSNMYCTWTPECTVQYFQNK